MFKKNANKAKLNVVQLLNINHAKYVANVQLS